MPKLYQPRAALTLLTGLLAFTAACSNSDLARSPVNSPAAPIESISTANPVAATAAPASKDPFQLGIERASSAYKIGKSAESRDDWRLVASRWQQAIELMKSVPAANARHSQAQQKIVQYQQNLAHAQQRANRSTKAANPDGVIVLPPNTALRTKPAPVPMAAVPQIAPQPAQPTSSQVFYAPIVRREGNTPVVQVMFNSSQPFDMIVDTGASGTLITRQMASALGVVTVAQATVDTASQKDVAFPLGYVQSVEVGGAVAENLLVAVAGSELDVGLLGHDFFGHYDVTIRENEVEFRERG